MTKQLKEAIDAYFHTRSGHARERGMTLIAQGHLSPVEIERLEWAISEWHAKRAARAE